MLSNLIPPHLEGDNIPIFKDKWKSSKDIRNRLKEIFNDRLSRLTQEEESIEDFSEPNWKERQAYRLGQRNSLREIIKYLDQEVEHE